MGSRHDLLLGSQCGYPRIQCFTLMNAVQMVQAFFNQGLPQLLVVMHAVRQVVPFSRKASGRAKAPL